MVSFTLDCAGTAVAVCCPRESTRDYCRDYLTEDAPLLSVALTQKDVDEERLVPGTPDLADELIEPSALHRRVAEALVGHGVIVVHGAAIATDGLCYLLCAPSGTGKTTHARSWLRSQKGSYVLNGDKPFVSVRDGIAYVSGSPWCGKEGMGVRGDAATRGRVRLVRGDADRIVRVQASEVLTELVAALHCPEVADARVGVVKVLAALCGVPLWRMEATQDTMSALVSSRAMMAAAHAVPKGA